MNRVRGVFPLLLAFVLGASPLALAQEADTDTDDEPKPPVEKIEEELVVVGELPKSEPSISATPILETTRSLSIETADAFRDRGALTLADVLEYTAGVDSNTFGPATRIDSARIRGTSASEYRDGQQIRFGFYNNTRTDIYTLEQVEVLKGPASVRFGKGTPGGLLNMVSKLAGANKSNEILVDFGTQSRGQVAADFNRQLGENFYVRAVGIYRDADHFVDEVTDDALIIMPSLTYDNGRSRVTLLYEYQDRESDTSSQFLPLTGTGCVDGDVTIVPSAVCVNADGRRIDSDTYHGEPGFNLFDTRSDNLTLIASHQLTDQVSLSGTVRRQEGEADYWQAWIDFLGTGVPRIRDTGLATRTIYRSDASSEQTAADVRARFSFKTGALQHELYIGAAYQDVTIDNALIFLRGQDVIDPFNPTFDGVPAIFFDPGNLSDPNPSTTEDSGFYFSDLISVDRWFFNLGARYDEVETVAATTQTDDATSLSVGVGYSFDNGLTPYASYAESFEPVIGTDGFTGNPLKPREGEQVEVGVKYDLAGGNTYLAVAYFETEESNLPNPAALIGQPNSQQEGIATTEGFELELLTQLGPLTIEGNLSLLDTEDANGLPFPSIAEDQVSTWIRYRPRSSWWNAFSFGFGARYLGERESNGFSSVLGPVRVVTDETVLLDALLAYDAADWRFTLNARNLTDEDYYGTCLARGDCFPGAGRSVVGRIGYRF
ncbi:MAG: TonB-dependent siderophore receptor [Acidobacteriota bacterium]